MIARKAAKLFFIPVLVLGLLFSPSLAWAKPRKAASQPSPAERSQALVKEGKELLSYSSGLHILRNRCDSIQIARDKFNQALELDPNNVETLASLSRNLEDLSNCSDWQRANWASLNRPMEKDEPEIPLHRPPLAINTLYSAMDKKFELAADLNPHDPILWAKWGDFLFHWANITKNGPERLSLALEASEKYQKAANNSDDPARLWLSCGNAFIDLTSSEEAPEIWPRFLTEADDYMKKYFDVLALTLREAEAQSEKTDKPGGGPNAQAQAWLNWGARLGNGLEGNREKETALRREAVEKLSRATQLAPGWPDGWMSLGENMLYASTQEDDLEKSDRLVKSAFEAYQNAVNLSASNHEAMRKDWSSALIKAIKKEPRSEQKQKLISMARQFAEIKNFDDRPSALAEKLAEANFLTILSGLTDDLAYGTDLYNQASDKYRAAFNFPANEDQAEHWQTWGTELFLAAAAVNDPSKKHFLVTEAEEKIQESLKYSYSKFLILNYWGQSLEKSAFQADTRKRSRDYLKAAVDKYEKAIQAEPQCVPCRQDLGRVLYKLYKLESPLSNTAQDLLYMAVSSYEQAGQINMTNESDQLILPDNFRESFEAGQFYATLAAEFRETRFYLNQTLNVCRAAWEIAASQPDNPWANDEKIPPFFKNIFENPWVDELASHIFLQIAARNYITHFERYLDNFDSGFIIGPMLSKAPGSDQKPTKDDSYQKTLNREIAWKINSIIPSNPEIFMDSWELAKWASLFRNMALLKLVEPQEGLRYWDKSIELLKLAEQKAKSSISEPPSEKELYELASAMAELGLVSAEKIAAGKPLKIIPAETQKLWLEAEKIRPGSSAYARARWAAQQGDLPTCRKYLAHSWTDASRGLFPALNEAKKDPAFKNIKNEPWFREAWYDLKP